MKRLLVVLLLVGSFRGFSQDSVVVTDGFRSSPGSSVRKTVATAAVGAVLAGSLVSSYYDWWSDSNVPFHFFREGWFNDGYLGIDKTGHFYTSYFYFNAFRNVMLWGGYDPSTAFWWAAGTTAFFAVSIEIGDGFSPYGFSTDDLEANMLGLGYAMLQTRYPFLKNFNVKWSYVPLEGYRWPPHFTDHYDGHTYWLTVNVHNLLPEKIAAYWPEFIQLAVGYGIDDKATVMKREGVIGLDFNFRAFSTTNEDVLLARNTLDMFHLPAPAVKFTEQKKPRWYLFHLN